MDMFDRISNDIKEAMKAKDKVRLETLRNIKKVFLEAKTAPGANDTLTDDTALKIMQKLVKQGKWRIMGGWYLQPDVVMPSGESIIRQIRVGNEFFKEHFGTKRVYEITGQPEITATWPASKMLWIKENKPEIHEKIAKVFLLEDYLLYRLTGNFVTEKTLQSSTIYYDINKDDWWDEMLTFIALILVD